MNNDQDHVIVIDANDNILNTMPKLQAHRCGVLHRAFSVFLFKKQNGSIMTLLQQRALGKYHSPGLWSNSCCSHQRLNENNESAVLRRLYEELGIKYQSTLKFIGKYLYKAKCINNLIEHELDYIFFGFYDGKLNPNTSEVKSLEWVNWNSLLSNNQWQNYTPWLPLLLKYLKDEKIDIENIYPSI